MNIISKTSLAIVSLLLGSQVFAEGHSKEWTFNTVKDGMKSDIAVSSCYSDDTKSKITYNWYPNSNSYDNSITINCGCNENLLLNDKVLVKLDGLSRLVTDGLPTIFKTHKCVASVSAESNTADSSGE